MKKTISMCSFALVAVLMTAAPVNAQSLYESPPSDDTMKESSGNYNSTMTAEGTVTSVDGAGSAITIRPFVATDLNNDQLTISIIPETKVYKNGNKINSADIQINDVVTVEYYNDPAGLQAVTINVE
jgi:hypothetical protein